MIEIKTLNSIELEIFIKSPEFEKQKFYPISHFRAASHTANPRADDFDVLLLLAYVDNELAGYLGALPDFLFTNPLNDRYEKCAWLSCLYIDETQRGKGLAKMLLEKCLEVWKDKLLVTEFTSLAESLYNKSGKFVKLQDKEGIRLYNRLDLAGILPSRYPSLKFLKPIFGFTDYFSNLLLDRRLKNYKRKEFNTQSIIWTDEETSVLLEKFDADSLFRRDPRMFTWIDRFPWIVDKMLYSEGKKYHFSSVGKFFANYHYKLFGDDNKLLAYLIFTVRDKSLKLSYAFMLPGSENLVADYIEDRMLEWKIKTFTCFNQELVNIFKTRKNLALYQKRVDRKYIITEKLHKLLPADRNYLIQDGDGDAVFT